MLRRAFAATVLMLAFAAPSQAGWLFSGHGGCCDDDCAPSCGAPVCAAPVCAAPVCAAPCATCGPSCAVPSCGCPTECGPVGCYDAGCCEVEEECCLKRVGRKLWDLEKRKNRCLLRTFFGCCDDDCHDGCECAPVEYYQPTCGAPSCGTPHHCNW